MCVCVCVCGGDGDPVPDFMSILSFVLNILSFCTAGSKWSSSCFTVSSRVPAGLCRAGWLLMKPTIASWVSAMYVRPV